MVMPLGNRDTIIAQEIREEGRKYELALAPVKRLLQEGSKLNMLPGTEEHLIKSGCLGTNHKMTEGALLLFRKQVEDYALALAAEIGEITRNANRNTIKTDDVYIAIDENGGK